MPSELRYTLFRATEVCEAVRLYRQRVGPPLPQGAVTDYTPERLVPDGGVRVRITIVREDGRAAGTSQISIEGTALAAALILYCSARGIPMPAKATKSLQITNGQVCLCSSLVQKSHEVPLPRLRKAGQMRRYSDA